MVHYEMLLKSDCLFKLAQPRRQSQGLPGEMPEIRVQVHNSMGSYREGASSHLQIIRASRPSWRRVARLIRRPLAELAGIRLGHDIKL